MAELITDRSPDRLPGAPNNPGELKRILEAVLLAAPQPLSLAELRKVFGDEIGSDVLRVLLDELRVEWNDRSLVEETIKEWEHGLFKHPALGRNTRHNMEYCGWLEINGTCNSRASSAPRVI